MLFANSQITNFREETDAQGKQWLVVNGVPLTEGVLNGRLVTADEFGKGAGDWNGMPVVITHPKQNGGSARVPTPDVTVAGRFYNAKMDGAKLVGQFWLDKQILLNDYHGRMILNSIVNGKAVEVSTGYYSASYPVNGEWHGKPYSLVDRDLKPDHIALLPNEEGACSINDGCGLNRNMKINACDCAACDKKNTCERSQFKVNADEADKTLPPEVDPIQDNLKELFEFVTKEKII